MNNLLWASLFFALLAAAFSVSALGKAWSGAEIRAAIFAGIFGVIALVLLGIALFV